LVTGLAGVKGELLFLKSLLGRVFYHFFNSVHRLKDFLKDFLVNGIFPLAARSLERVAAVDGALELVSRSGHTPVGI
jgi:hypothetical protein